MILLVKLAIVEIVVLVARVAKTTTLITRRLWAFVGPGMVGCRYVAIPTRKVHLARFAEMLLFSAYLVPASCCIWDQAQCIVVLVFYRAAAVYYLGQGVALCVHRCRKRRKVFVLQVGVFYTIYQLWQVKMLLLICLHARKLLWLAFPDAFILLVAHWELRAEPQEFSNQMQILLSYMRINHRINNIV